MRIENVKKIYKKFNELSLEQQKNEIEKELNGDCWTYYESNNYCYEELLNSYFDEINNSKYLCGDYDDLHTSSSSQGWYYDFRRTFLKTKSLSYFEDGIYTMDLSGVDLSVSDVFYYHSNDIENYIKDNAVITKNSKPYVHFEYNSNADFINFDEIKNKKVVKYFEKIISDVAKEVKEVVNTLNRYLTDWNNYYPTEEEVKDNFIANDIEFLVSEEIIA